MKKLNFTLTVIEEPKGNFTAWINEVRGCVVQERDETSVIREVFKQAWLCLKLDSANLKG